jgi:5-methylcytosine-specific restriction protein A
MSPREVAEWIGKSPDAKVPDRVRMRVLERYGHKCYLSGAEIRPGTAWEIEHIQALILGGEHREKNMAPALVEPHKAKTATEMKIKAKIARVGKKSFLGKKKSSLSNPLFKKLMDGTVVRRDTGEIVGR